MAFKPKNSIDEKGEAVEAEYIFTKVQWKIVMWEEQQVDLPLPGATVNCLGASLLTPKMCLQINNKDSPSTGQSSPCGQWFF